MAKEYNVGSRLYLPVWVTEKETNLMMGPDKSTTITDAKFSYAYWHGKTGEGKVRYGEPGLLLTTEEVAEEYKDKATRRIQLLEKENATYRETISNRVEENEELDGENKELKSRNAELEALLNEVMATRDEAIRQNDELRKENENLKSDCNDWKDTANDRIVDVQNLTAERDNLKADLTTQKEVNEELKARIRELEVECEKWKATAQNCENSAKAADNAADGLRLENKKLKAELDQRNKDFLAMKKDRDELDSIGGKLRAENENLKAWYEEANKTATEAAEANDDLKAKIADLRNRVGEQLAQIQDLNAEVHFHKEFGEGLDKQQKELQARYDELDSVNKEQAEKIRKLDKALTDLKKRNDDLQAENTNLTFLLEDAPEKETTKTLHVVLNDGTEIEFRRYTAYDYRTDIKMFVVKDGERFIAGFNRGDKSFNFAYWWTE